MNTWNFLFNIIHVLIILLITTCIAGCSILDKSSAPIVSVSRNIKNCMYGDTSILPFKSIKKNVQKTISPTLMSKSQITSICSLTDKINFQHTQTKNKYIRYKRNYSNIPKGSYKGDSYTVNYGDTLFYIAWITNNNLHKLALRNNISAPYTLNIGQILHIDNKVSHAFYRKSINIQNQNFKSTEKIEKLSNVQFVTKYPKILIRKKDSKVSINDSKTNHIPMTPIITSVTDSNKKNIIGKPSSFAIPTWIWPTNGKIIEKFSFSMEGNRGIDISGNKGQAILAAADGRVVYVGNALRGYGNLIIIKHNNDYLSAYAHNDETLVKEQQEVKLGQKIATMGSTGTSSIRSHFEIRYKGKSVNPLLYLPQR